MGKIEIKHPKLFSECWNNLSECEKIACKQSAEAQEERLNRLQHEEWEKKHNLRTVYPKVQWTDRGSLKDTSLNLAADALSLQVKSFTQKIADYVESQIKEFLEDNKISERQWLKRGVIQSLPPDIGCQSYILYYKNWRMEVRRKVTVRYDFIIK
jgi:hypothetical protein